MARIKPNQNPDAKSQELLRAVKEKLGSTPNFFTTLANSPAALGAFLSASGALAGSKLSAALREQIALTVAGTNGCDYCASAHTAIGKKQNIAESELTQSLQARSSDGKTQAALTLARKIVETRGHVSDADVQAARTAGYSDGEIIEIVAVVGINIFTNYVNHVAGTENDFPAVSTASVKKAA